MGGDRDGIALFGGDLDAYRLLGNGSGGERDKCLFLVGGDRRYTGERCSLFKFTGDLELDRCESHSDGLVDLNFCGGGDTDHRSGDRYVVEWGDRGLSGLWPPLRRIIIIILFLDTNSALLGDSWTLGGIDAGIFVGTYGAKSFTGLSIQFPLPDMRCGTYGSLISPVCIISWPLNVSYGRIGFRDNIGGIVCACCCG